MTESSIERSIPTALAKCLLGGLILSLPIGWLLATAAMLPFFLGLFFSMLFGLVVGAAVYRLGASAAPIPRPILWLLGLIITLAISVVSLASEYYNVRGYHLPRYGQQGWHWTMVPGDISQQVRDSFPDRSFTPPQVIKLRQETSSFFVRHLQEQYPPGGVVGYVRWVIADETLACPRVFSPIHERIKPKQGGIKWIVRVSLSFVLLWGAVQSQVLSLASGRDEEPA